MDPALWRRAVALYEAALARPRRERSQWIVRAAADDPALVELARKLLAAHDRVEENEPLRTLPKLATKPLLAHKVGDIVGNFQLLSHLGTGGMGEVWQARYADHRLDRDVAVKICSVSTAASGNFAAHERFVRERRFLEKLEHPNIARLYDAGVAEGGRAFLALELVDGCAIDLYCKTNRLTVHARIGLFLQVIEATAYAHQQLVLHRDLKPSNIMVDRQGTIKLLDFGVAKLIDSSVVDDVELTKVAGGAITLAYAAPEQITHQALSTATDVYGLGATLYRLLTGKPPYRPESDTRYALQQAILHSDAIPASTHAYDAEFLAEIQSTADELRRSLAGDLTAILAKALKKEPKERYASATALAEDLRRYLRMQPVTARPDNFLYRAHRFVRRNRLAVAATSVAICALSVTTVIALQQGYRATRQAAETARQLHRVETAHKFVTGLFANADPENAKGKPIVPTEVLRKGLNDAKVLFANDPETLSGILAQIGDIYFRMGLPEEMYAAQRARVDALRAVRAVDASQMVDALIALGQAQADSRTLAVREGAEGVFHEALALAQSSKAVPIERSIFATALIADQRRIFQRFDEAERLSASASAMGRVHLSPSHSTNVAALQVQALLARDRGRIDEARALFAQVIAADRESDRGAVDRFNVKRQLATLEFDAGSFLRARTLAHGLLSEAERELGDVNSNLAPLRRLAISATERAGFLDEAAREAKSLLAPELASADPLRVGAAQMTSARVLLSADVLKEVPALLDQASLALATYPLWLNRLASLQAEYSLRIGDHRRADTIIDEALRRVTERGQQSGREAASLHEWRGRLHVARGDYVSARHAIAQACRLRTNLQQLAHPQRVTCEAMRLLVHEDMDRSQTLTEFDSLAKLLTTSEERAILRKRLDEARRHASTWRDQKQLHRLELFSRD